MGRKRHLIVFAREPRVGQVKTRLAASLGRVGATMWYRRQLGGLLRALNGRDAWSRYLFVTPSAARHAPIWPRGWTVSGQGAGDLGQRMRRALSGPGAGPVVLVGSDIPALGPRHIRAAFRALGRADVVLGPAADGGYWLIGLARRRAPPAFGPVRWSTEHALNDTRAAFDTRTRVALLETLSDVDTVEDLAALKALRGRSAPRRS